MSSRIFGSGIRRREDPRLITGARHLHRRPDAARTWCTRSWCAARTRTRASRASMAAARRSRAGRRRGLHRRGHRFAAGRRPAPGCCRMPSLKIAQVSAASPATSSATSATSSPWSSPRRRRRRTTRADLVEVDYEPLPCVLDPEQAVAAGAPQLHARHPEQHRVQVDAWTAATSTRRSPGADVVIKRADRPAAADPERDGAARRVRQVERRVRRADARGTRRRIRTSCASSRRS